MHPPIPATTCRVFLCVMLFEKVNTDRQEAAGDAPANDSSFSDYLFWCR
jgi:hypothetical protein